jgi:predicted amidohydrolase
VRSPLIVAAAQPPCTPCDLAANGRAHAAAIKSADARLVVFPELSLTGYELDASPVRNTDEAFAPIVDACGAAGSDALVGAPVSDEQGRRHIAALRVSAAGVEVAYNKTWLSTEESTRFSPGSCAVAVDIDGWRIGLGICKDTGTPEHRAQIAALGVDIYAAGLVHAPSELPVQDERGASIARQCGAYVIFASFAGPTGEGYGMTAGSSTIWSPAGEILARAGVEPGGVARASISPSGLRATPPPGQRF